MATEALYTYENTVRVLDTAVVKWLSNFKVDYDNLGGVPKKGHPILTVFASPERAFANVSDMLVRDGFIAGDDPAVQNARAMMDWTVLPLPVISIERDDPIISDELANTAGQWRNMAFDSATGQYQSHDYPLHYLTQYRFNFWCIKQSTRAAFVEWILDQIGRRGSWQSELFLPIEHPAPWGTQLHQMRYTGSANLSDLEGEDARHIRQLYSFILRSWAFRKPSKADIVYTVQQDFHTGSELSDSSDLDVLNDAGRWSTGNLYAPDRFPPVAYGAGQVLAADGLSVQVKTSTSQDGVLFARALAVPDAFGRSIWSVAFSAASSRPWVLTWSQMDTTSDDDGNDTSSSEGIGHLDVPAGEQTVHEFIVCDANECGVAVSGANSAATVTLSGVDFRQLAERPRVTPTGMAANGANIDYFFTGLARTTYLVIAIFNMATPGAVDGVVTITDDSVAPDNTRVRAIHYPEQAGVALHSMPKTDSVRFSIPGAISLHALYAIRYDGIWKGASV